ncbi:unnamed protein product (macronuclear) [Paramecium tetraurelia]|uniref:LNS2/PITP domain-containing protein n=1 Tax=Paramecium tetraurelia TaxID=5888 RepID=A0D325_PARTE|nr:uncharacterized protein GSPATT00012927001 [Paramecium tetraurelia]CAK77442.1 unnamed protein product [Paramecium tetraurelia]|eukprot:XP_001444839.1 hypothetical protein (macronuclear) [Paramecium tetraurelia strain d4-2]
MSSILNSIAKMRYKTKAVFSGVTDVVVVDQGEEKYASTPFNVKFGKLKFLNAGEELVIETLNIKEKSTIKQMSLIKLVIFINGEKRDDIQFYLDDDQIGHFAYDQKADIEELKQKYLEQTKQNMNLQQQQESKLIPQNKFLVLSRVPTSKTIQSLKLKHGLNTITYEVECKRLGLQHIECQLFMIKQNQKIFISDIDGTITKSPTKGMILSTFGRDYTQDHICEFYNRLTQRNYLILYMSARSMVQYESTKEYLLRQQQQGIQLPPGPLFLSPQELLEAFTIEVIKKQTDILKSQMLNDLVFTIGVTGTIQGGMGDRLNDIQAYKMANIEYERILLINKKGEIVRVNNEMKEEKFTIKEIIQKMDQIF